MTTPPPDPVHLLLVDDLEENLLALGALLRRDGLVLLKARSGSDALELLLKYDVALALVDVQMPGMDGFELAELMRGAERTRRVPIIFLTAGAVDWRRRFRGYEAGAVDFLQKPIEADVLRSKTEVFLELYRQRQEVVRQRDELRAATNENARLLKESRQYAEALKEADRRKDEFLAMLAHELRNPLGPVRNAVEILRRSAAGQGEADVLKVGEILSRQVDHMSRLVDDLLDVARIARGRIQIRRERCDLGTVVRNTAEAYRPMLAAAGVQLEVRAPDHPLPVLGDPIRLAQVVGNLLHNAGKFTPSGGRVEVRAAVEPDPRPEEGSEEGWAVVQVQDDGAGMDAPLLKRLFEPLSQAHQNLDRNKGGLGLGLALVRGLVELHRGSAVAESGGPGMGSTFTVRLPAAVPSPENIPAAPVAGKAAVAAGLRIVVIEDNRDAAESLRLLLSLFGHEVHVAFDGAAGLAAARSFRPDVLLSDLGLPGTLDGYGVARAVRADPELSRMHLVALSGYGQEEDRRRTQEAGFDRHLVKPVDPAVLERAMAAAPRRRGAVSA